MYQKQQQEEKEKERMALLSLLEEMLDPNVFRMRACVHGGDVQRTAVELGISWREMIDFSASVNPLGPSPKVLKAICDNLWQIPFYPDPCSELLKESISKHIEGIDEGNVIVGNGSTELIWLFSDVLLSEGDKVIIPAPTYGEYETAISKKGTKPIFLNLDQEKEFRIVYEDVIDRISYEKPKMVFICNPNNPPSKVIRREEMLSIVEECARKNVFVFVDEAYVDFVDKPWEVTVAPDVNDYWNLFVLHSITKIHGMPGLRVGYGISNHEFINVLEGVKQPWNVNCLAQVAAIEGLKDEDHLGKTREIIASGRKYLAEKIGFFKSLYLYKPEANFLLININKAGMTAAQLKGKLARKRILIRDCSSFRNIDRYHVRVSVRTPEENQKLIEALKETLNEEK